MIDVFLKKYVVHIIKNYFGLTVLAILLPYLLFAAGYNMLCQDIIAQRILTLESVVRDIKPLWNYETSEITKARSRALVSRSVTILFFTDENPDVTFEIYSKYFEGNNWKIVECDYRKKILVVENSNYIVSLYRSKDEEYNNEKEKSKTWVIYVSFNDFFSKYNL